MRVARTRVILWTAAVLAWVAAAASLVTAVRVPVPLDVPTAGDPDAGATLATPTGLVSEPSPARLLALCDGPGRCLRGPLYDAPPPPPAAIAAPPPPPPLSVSLAGTIVEPDARRCRAVLQVADGTTVLRRVGDRFGLNGLAGTDAVLIAVTPGVATVRYGGQTVTLRVPSKPSVATPAGGY